VKEFFKFFLVQCLAYALITWNWRSIAHTAYLHIFVSDLLYAAVNFKIIKHVADAKSNAALAGYILGGACGSLAATWLTRFLGS
jgi:hypothetical protein